MARGIKLTRFQIQDANHWHLRGYRLRVEATFGCDMPDEVFVYRRTPPDPYSGEEFDEFQTVASFPDLAEYPAGGPGVSSPFFRLNYIEVDVRSTQQYDEVWTLIRSQVEELVKAMDRADLLVTAEEHWIGDVSGCASSSSESAQDQQPPDEEG